MNRLITKVYFVKVTDMKIRKNLSEIIPCERAFVLENHAKGSIRRRLFDIGLIENTPVECVGRSPGGGLSAFLIRGAVIALRDEDSANILIRDIGGCGNGEKHTL